MKTRLTKLMRTTIVDKVLASGRLAAFREAA